MKEFGVFIGRFQPFHNGHLAVVKDALTKVKTLVIVIGSSNAARNIKNPWSAFERQTMIGACLSSEEFDRVEFVHVNDYTYNDTMWVSHVQDKVGDEIYVPDEEVLIFGRDKDYTTYYLNLFPQWQFSPAPGVAGMDATGIRKMYFDCDLNGLKSFVPEPVFECMKSYMMKDATTRTPEFASLQDEYQHIAKYKELWKAAPYPPTFVTIDAVVIKSGHVLMVRRGCQPGKGLMALPGGFLNPNERIVKGCLRELKEETGLPLSVEELEKLIVDQRVFDHPDRSLRGRTVTHAFAFNLGSGKLPRVKGSDDAEKAFWVPINEIIARGNEVYEDHAHIVHFFSSRF